MKYIAIISHKASNS